MPTTISPFPVSASWVRLVVTPRLSCGLTRVGYHFTSFRYFSTDQPSFLPVQSTSATASAFSFFSGAPRNVYETTIAFSFRGVGCSAVHPSCCCLCSSSPRSKGDREGLRRKKKPISSPGSPSSFASLAKKMEPARLTGTEPPSTDIYSPSSRPCEDKGEGGSHSRPHTSRSGGPPCSATKRYYYSVAQGRKPGIYMSWEKCSEQVTGAKHAIFKKFSSLEDARRFLLAHRPSSPRPLESPVLATSPRLASAEGQGLCTAMATSFSPMSKALWDGERRTATQLLEIPIEGSSRKRATGDDVLSYAASPPFLDHVLCAGLSLKGGADSSDDPPRPCKKPRLEKCSPHNSSGPPRSTVEHVLEDDDDDAVAITSPSMETPLPAPTPTPSKGVPIPNSATPSTMETAIPPPLVVYVDGACSHNGKGASKAKGGYGVYYGPGDCRNVSRPLPSHENQTNNRAELYAVIYAMKTTLDVQQKEEHRFVLSLIDTLSACGRIQEAEELSQCCRQCYPTSSLEDSSVGGTALSSSLDAGTSVWGSIPLLNPHNWWERQQRCYRYMMCCQPSGGGGGACERVFPAGVLLPQLHVHTDSQYVVNGLLSYCKTWTLKKYRLQGTNKPVLNQDLWRFVVALRDVYNTLYYAQRQLLLCPLSFASHEPFSGRHTKRDDGGNRVSSASSLLSSSLPKVFTPFKTKNNAEDEGVLLFHVKGHSNNHGNVQADRLAVIGAKMKE